MSKPGVFSEAIDNDQNGEDILLKSKIKLEQNERSKRTKEMTINILTSVGSRIFDLSSMKIMNIEQINRKVPFALFLVVFHI